MYPDRVVAIRGATVDSMSSAESALSTKLRECHQRDYVSMTRVCYHADGRSHLRLRLRPCAAGVYLTWGLPSVL